MEETLHLPELELNCVAELCDIVTVAIGDVNKQAAIVGSDVAVVFSTAWLVGISGIV